MSQTSYELPDPLTLYLHIQSFAFMLASLSQTGVLHITAEQIPAHTAQLHYQREIEYLNLSFHYQKILELVAAWGPDPEEVSPHLSREVKV